MGLMSLGGFLAERRQAAKCPAAPLRNRFQHDRKASTAIEFAIVGLLYFFVLIFAVEGGIYYLQATVIDFATEQASRAIMINQGANNAGVYTDAPQTAALFQALVYNDSSAASDGLLSQANIQVAVQMAAPVTGNAVTGPGFASIPPVAVPNGSVYEYVPGSCTVDYTTSTVAGVTKYTLVANHGCTDGNCAATQPSFNLLPVNGELSGGAYDATTGKYLNATYSCSAGQDILVQVQYSDSPLSALVAYLFGPITTTLAFQVEPATT
jgi:Flp pilus assembly protein TadG